MTMNVVFFASEGQKHGWKDNSLRNTPLLHSYVIISLLTALPLRPLHYFMGWFGGTVYVEMHFCDALSRLYIEGWKKCSYWLRSTHSQQLPRLQIIFERYLEVFEICCQSFGRNRTTKQLMIYMNMSIKSFETLIKW